ncbi:hypothetical protein BESB_019180 [Besnoitia besnoiti]|uniref:Transmembrane protein n=1 Tax=Besnoitia besnoiti TaxID=94643 RepID=A0A2A9M8L8_BESBE|nr:hypothetical protein BESB_019180 [Besnoitia besnoiti]PFH31977.1 hypothetical protein BESB_019180 [Besnoitia besnoiti]
MRRRCSRRWLRDVVFLACLLASLVRLSLSVSGTQLARVCRATAGNAVGSEAPASSSGGLAHADASPLRAESLLRSSALLLSQRRSVPRSFTPWSLAPGNLAREGARSLQAPAFLQAFFPREESAWGFTLGRPPSFPPRAAARASAGPAFPFKESTSGAPGHGGWTFAAGGLVRAHFPWICCRGGSSLSFAPASCSPDSTLERGALHHAAAALCGFRPPQQRAQKWCSLSFSALLVQRWHPARESSWGDDEEEEESGARDEDMGSFSPEPSKLRSRLGSLTEPGPFPEPPPESPYWPAFPAKDVTPVPAQLPRWHSRSPFPALKPRGLLYPANPKKIRPPKYRQFRGAAPPPCELPPSPPDLQRNFRTWVRDARYEYPQFTTIPASIKYRRRLKRSSRKLDWRLRSLQDRRIYFAWRRNMRDQETHRWLREKEQWSRLTARFWKQQYALQAQRWLSPAGEAKSATGRPAEGGSCVSDAQQEQEAEMDVGAAPSSSREALIAETTDLVAHAEDGGSTRRRSGEPASIFGGSPAASTAARGGADDSAEDLLRTADPEAVTELLRRGYTLPPMTAAVAASPIPWWSSAKGLHKWRGRKTATNVQSRWVNWASHTRVVEPVVAGQLLRRRGRVLRRLQQKGIELMQKMRQLNDTREPYEEAELEADSPTDERTACAAPAALVGSNSGKESSSAPLMPLDSSGDATEGHGEKTACPSSGEDMQRERCPPRELDTERRRLSAVEAAMDVALMLGQSVVTKASGAPAPYDVHSPFMRSSTSSRRRRMRMRGRAKDPEQKDMTRQERRLANFAARQAAEAYERAMQKEARRKAWEEAQGREAERSLPP